MRSRPYFLPKYGLESNINKIKARRVNAVKKKKSRENRSDQTVILRDLYDFITTQTFRGYPFITLA